MKLATHPSRFVLRACLSLTCFFGALGILYAANGGGSAAPQTAVKVNHYIGVAKCQSCHKADASGNQYAAWEASKHSKAFETLATDAAKAAAKELGIADPQKAPECLKCHTTAYGEAPEMIKRGFKPEKGVQCESCHGPGEAHMKARFAAAASAPVDAGAGAPAYTEVPEGEILTNPPAETCKGCHNAESPSYKPFCFLQRRHEIAHPDPRKPHTPEQLLVCGCGESCACDHDCADHECGVAPAADGGK